ncbi:MAG: EAL domain-containing protein, partial [Gaiellales bacterium]
LPAAIVALGERLDLEVVAEGIEQATQATLLRDLGCGLGQGFLFAHAMNSPDLLRYLLALKNAAERPSQADAA